MKKILPAIIITLFVVACRQADTARNTRNIELLTDSTIYQNNNIYTDSPVVSENNSEQTETGKKTGNIPASSSNTTNVKKTSKPRTVKTVSNPERATDSVNQTEVQVENSPKNDAGTGSGTVSANDRVQDASTVQKKGMSKAAQGAIIGGAAGAVGGAIIAKKKGVGAVIGGIAGAAGGYIIGKNKDKKESGGKKQ